VNFLEHNLSEEHTSLELLPMSDLHVGDPRFNRRMFDACRNWLLEKPNRYTILNGDIMNVATKDSVSDVYEESLNPGEQLAWCKTEFRPIADRILCITEGNHEARITRATSIRVLAEMAESLGIADRFHPAGCLLKITFGKKSCNNKRQCYTIYTTHGSAGGVMEGGKALAMARQSGIVLADCYLIGHSHWKAAFKQSIYVPDLYNNKVRLVEQTFVNTSSLLEWGGYAQMKGYKPGAQGSPHITLWANPKRVEVLL
jgi:predicted phosphodiesterase